MEPPDSVHVVLHQFVVTNFLFDNGDVADDASLLGEGIIDSTGVLELVTFVEKQFGIEVADEELVPENFDSIAGLSAFVRLKTAKT
jgi:acyl carrier protein